MSSPWMMSKENYYAVLEIVTTDIYTVQQIEVKKAYRRMALQFHPDKGHGGGDVLFQRVQEAYEVLNDVQKQNAYRSWYMSHFKTKGVSSRAIDKETKKRRNIVDNIVGAEEAKRREQQRIEREREAAEKKAAEAKRKKKEARERARRAKAEAKRREEEARKKEQERMKKVKEKERRENDVLERRRQEERAKAEERIRKLKEEELRKLQESTRPSTGEKTRPIPESLSKNDYLKRLQQIQESSSLMADERDKLTEESERLAKKAELIRSSAEAAFSKAKKKYKDSLKRSKIQLERALQFDLESDSLHSQVLDILEEYTYLTDFYGSAYGFPEEEEEEGDSDADEEPLGSTSVFENSEVPSSFGTPNKSPLPRRPMSAHEYIKINRSPLNYASSEQGPGNFPKESTSNSNSEPLAKDATTPATEYMKQDSARDPEQGTMEENRRTQSSNPIPGRSYATLRPRTHYSKFPSTSGSTIRNPQQDTCTLDQEKRNDPNIVKDNPTSTQFAPDHQTFCTFENVSSPVRPDQRGRQSKAKSSDFSFAGRGPTWIFKKGHNFNTIATQAKSSMTSDGRFDTTQESFSESSIFGSTRSKAASVLFSSSRESTKKQPTSIANGSGSSGFRLSSPPDSSSSSIPFSFSSSRTADSDTGGFGSGFGDSSNINAEPFPFSSSGSEAATPISGDFSSGLTGCYQGFKS